jgi:hypothetical protein
VYLCMAGRFMVAGHKVSGQKRFYWFRTRKFSFCVVKFRDICSESHCYSSDATTKRKFQLPLFSNLCKYRARIRLGNVEIYFHGEI